MAMVCACILVYTGHTFLSMYSNYPLHGYFLKIRCKPPTTISQGFHFTFFVKIVGLPCFIYTKLCFMSGYYFKPGGSQLYEIFKPLTAKRQFNWIFIMFPKLPRADLIGLPIFRIAHQGPI